MPGITQQARAAFREQGYVVIPGVLDDWLIAAGRELAAAMLAEQPPEDGRRGPYFLWPRFGPAGHGLLDFYRDAGIGRMAGRGRSRCWPGCGYPTSGSGTAATCGSGRARTCGSAPT
jgi:hypothetical protein